MRERTLPLHRLIPGFLLSCALAVPWQLPAQQAGQPAPPAESPTPTQPAQDPAAPPAQTAPGAQAPHNDRIFWAVPNYLTVENASSLPPLTDAQKFKLVASETFDPMEFVVVGAIAALNQASNTNPTFGQGLRGYSRRYAIVYADGGISSFMVSGVLPSVLRQDPRYYQKGKGSLLQRAASAAARVVVTRSDSGKPEFNFSEIFGNGLAAAVSNAYHPGPRTLGSNINIWGTEIGWDAAAFELKEFWPDVRRLLLRHLNSKRFIPRRGEMRAGGSTGVSAAEGGAQRRLAAHRPNYPARIKDGVAIGRSIFKNNFPPPDLPGWRAADASCSRRRDVFARGHSIWWKFSVQHRVRERRALDFRGPAGYSGFSAILVASD